MTMRLKPTYQNHLKDWAKGTAIVYGVLVGIYLISLLFVAIKIEGAGTDPSFYGLEVVSQVFIFISGIAMFKPNLKLALANGISRRTEFTSAVLAAATVAAVVVFLNLGINLLFSTINSYEFHSEFGQAYGDFNFSNRFAYCITGFFYGFFGIIADFIFGYFIGALYYRMSKLLKIIVSVGVPAVLFIVMPVVGAILFSQGNNRGLLVKILTVIMKFSSIIVENPYYTTISSIVFAVVFGIFSYLLIRRAPIKEQG